MKLTKSQLKQIIKEELSARLNEDYVKDWYDSASPLAREMVNVTLGGDVTKAEFFWQKNFLKNSKDEEVIEAAKQVINRLDPHRIKEFLPKAEGEPHRFGVAKETIVSVAEDASRYPDGAGCADGTMKRPCARTGFEGGGDTASPVPDAPWPQSPSAPQLENKMKLTKSQLKQIIKEELNEVGVPFLKTGLGADAVPKGGEQYNLVFKDNGEFFDGPFTKEKAEHILVTQDPNEELEIKLATGSSLEDIEAFYDEIAARYNENKTKLTKSQLKQIIKEEVGVLLNEGREDNTIKFKVGDKVRHRGWLEKKGIGEVVQMDFGWLNQGQVGVQWPTSAIDPLTDEKYIHQLGPEELELVETPEGEI